jgi:uncharacterized protein (DUF1330 family)
MIALIRVKNLSDFNTYREKVPVTLEPYGGEIRFRAEKPMTLDDENGLGDFSQVALFWFPTADAMTDWYESDAYHDLLELRASAGNFTIIGVDPDFNCA